MRAHCRVDRRASHAVRDGRRCSALNGPAGAPRAATDGGQSEPHPPAAWSDVVAASSLAILISKAARSGAAAMTAPTTLLTQQQGRPGLPSLGSDADTLLREKNTFGNLPTPPTHNPRPTTHMHHNPLYLRHEASERQAASTQQLTRQLTAGRNQSSTKEPKGKGGSATVSAGRPPSEAS